mmetsp:Transcript_15495/g.27494  ORF Transcript_15495/g.27494 Transcript_15495/m.27494 type:complete len:242 (+) Transcript_15495:937-1662(+)
MSRSGSSARSNELSSYHGCHPVMPAPPASPSPAPSSPRQRRVIGMAGWRSNTATPRSRNARRGSSECGITHSHSSSVSRTSATWWRSASTGISGALASMPSTSLIAAAFASPLTAPSCMRGPSMTTMSNSSKVTATRRAVVTSSRSHRYGIVPRTCSSSNWVYSPRQSCAPVAGDEQHASLYAAAVLSCPAKTLNTVTPRARSCRVLTPCEEDAAMSMLRKFADVEPVQGQNKDHQKQGLD